MLPLEDWMDVQALHREGLSVREIARQTGHSRNTITRLLAQPAPQPYLREPESSKLVINVNHSYRRRRLECPAGNVGFGFGPFSFLPLHG